MLSPNDLLCILEQGNIEMEGLVPWGSNYTFLVVIEHEGEQRQGIYKPRRGERPLWDFPTGTLCQRERAAYLVSEAIGWHIVPPTVLRHGPQGWGSLQLFIEHDPEETFFALRDQFGDQLRRIALFDSFINNADRKGGHIIRDEADHLWGIDHGICFHTDYKLRTVIWDYAGERIAAELLDGLTQLQLILDNKQHRLTGELQELLSRRELTALCQRLVNLSQSGRFLDPGPGRPYPWPLV